MNFKKKLEFGYTFNTTLQDPFLFGWIGFHGDRFELGL